MSEEQKYQRSVDFSSSLKDVQPGHISSCCSPDRLGTYRRSPFPPDAPVPSQTDCREKWTGITIRELEAGNQFGTGRGESTLFIYLYYPHSKAVDDKHLN